MTSKHNRGVDFTDPGTYRLRLQGRLDASWSGCLGGLTISTTGGEGTWEETLLVGRLPDQTALAGVLNTLYELHLSVLNVERISDDDGI